MEFNGSPYPITKDARGFFHTQSGIDQVKSDMLVLLLTNPGERVMLPEYGTPLKKLIFEPNDGGVELQAKDMIINSIRNWEPRITVQNITISSSIDQSSLNALDNRTEVDHILSIVIDFFDPENIKEVQQLKLELPLSGT